MKRSSISTMFLRTVLAGIAVAVLALCTVALPAAIRAELRGDFDYGPIFLGLYVTVVPFGYALYQAMRLLGNIDQNQAFSLGSVHALRRIKQSAAVIAALFAAGMPYVFYVADRDDAPGVALVGFVVIGASVVIAAAAALFQKLFQNALAIKSENDLTV